jgi:hypothetical protein
VDILADRSFTYTYYGELMDFTEPEAKAKEWRHVVVIKEDEDFLNVGVPKGTRGRVETVGNGGGTQAGIRDTERGWFVNIRFYPPRKHQGVLIKCIYKEQYENLLQEADMVPS